MTLTKADLVRQVYNTHHDLTKPQASDAVEIFLLLSKSSLIRGQILMLSGFGTFTVKNKRTRLGRNPQNGNTLTISARRVVAFKPSGVLRSRINLT